MLFLLILSFFPNQNWFDKYTFPTQKKSEKDQKPGQKMWDTSSQ